MNNTAIAFLRVSSNKQRDNTSHETQEQEIIEYCKEKKLELVTTFRMVESAQDSNSRKQYKQGISFALNKGIKNILFYVFDRETRNLTDNEKNETLVREGKIVIHYVKEKKIFSHDSPDSDFFLRDVHAVTNKQYIRQLRTKVQDACVTKAESGWFPGSQPPLGYMHEKIDKNQKNGTIIVRSSNEKEVRQVIREFELRSQGMPCSEIRQKIIMEGFIPSNKIGAYQRSIIEKRIRNPFYFGGFLWRGKTYKGKHEIIIPQEVLSKVKASTGLYTFTKKDDKGLFGGGWLRCTCGCNVIFDPKTKTLSTGFKKTFHYYHCTNGKKLHPKYTNVTEDHLFSEFGKAVDEMTISESVAEQIAEALNETHKYIQEHKKKEIDNYRLGLDQIEKEEDQAYRDFRQGILDEKMYHRQITFLRSERKRFTDLLESSNIAMDGAYLETAQSTLELAKLAKSVWEKRNAHDKLVFLKTILSNQVLDGVNVRYELRKPFGTISKFKDLKIGGGDGTTLEPLLEQLRIELSLISIGAA